jgi:hypothetical protein
MGEQLRDRRTREPCIDRVQHGAHARHRHVKLEMAAAVPGERRHAVARAHAQPAQGMGEPGAARQDIGVGRPLDAVGVTRRHRLLGMELLDPPPHEIERQRHVLHQALDHPRNLTRTLRAFNNFSNILRLS